MSTRTASRRGFTLVEMLIVVLVIAILAVIIIARLLSASRKGKEAAMRADLTHLRTAIAAFEADCGAYPAQLADVVAEQPGPATGANGESIQPGSYKGPYLTPSGGIDGLGIPQNPFASATAAIDQHWSYTANSGLVNSAVPGTTVNGIPFSNL